MVLQKKWLAVLLLFPAVVGFSQKRKKAEKQLTTNLRTHINYLASDQLEGRRAGTKGEELAHNYITAQFSQMGLQPKGNSSGWLQAFEINEGREIKKSTYLFINGTELAPQEDYFPLPWSASKSFEAAITPGLNEKNAPWCWDIKELLEENSNNPHFELPQSILENAGKFAERGASALIIYNSGEQKESFAFNPKDRTPSASIPVLYITQKGKSSFLKEGEELLDIKCKVEIGDKKRTGHNVAGYIDNGAASTVIIGAHYDHLGYGEDGNSMLRGNGKGIHNGADDNASGTAGMLELARLLKEKKYRKNNYLFLAFSAEELGLNGSKYFTDNPTIELNKVSYMINMDMIGRLNDSSKVLTVGGYGTSPWWGSLFRENGAKKDITVKFDSSGTGPSDHTSFYRKDIPVLFFFTGLHSDYHRPSDDADKINYNGEAKILQYITDLIAATADQPKLAFTKTRETQTTTSARFSVSLGIMPDYTFTGNGVHVDGVSEGRPAQKAGIQKGDVLIQLGPHAIVSVESYMQTLGKFKKGDKTTLKYKRGEAIVETAVEF
jgi:Zn-dependent M28 family amino/carboxypeptidase